MNARRRNIENLVVNFRGETLLRISPKLVYYVLDGLRMYGPSTKSITANVHITEGIKIATIPIIEHSTTAPLANTAAVSHARLAICLMPIL
jgi:hypothetical protein